MMSNRPRPLQRWSLLGALSLALASIGCGAGSERGGITAQIVFGSNPSSAASHSLLATQHALRNEAVPPMIARLEIVARDGAGSPLASTNLFLSPTGDQLKLEPQGGTWSLVGVPPGTDRQVEGKAYLGSNPDRRFDGLLLFQGAIRGIVVRAGELSNAGVLRLDRVPGVRYPPLDLTGPDAPNPIALTVLPRGRALSVTFTRPSQDGVAGYVVAIGESNLVGTPPSIGRGRVLEEGDAIAGGVIVKRRIRSPIPEPVTIDGLANNTSYRVLVYAYDTDLDDKPLNYSEAASGFGVPKKTDPPGAVRDLSIARFGQTEFDIAFTAPGDIGDVGTPERYELRATTDRRELESPSTFASLPAVMPPPVRPGGERVTFRRTALELGVAASDRFFAGVRAVDSAGNFGPIAIADYSPFVQPLRIDRLEPEIAVTGLEVTIRGQGFGARAPMVTLTGSTARSVTLPVVRSDDSSAAVLIPAAARTGTVTVRRSDGQTAGQFLPVVARIEGAFDPFAPPFEIIAADPEIGLTVSGVYRERNLAGFEGAIERRIGTARFGDPLVPLSSTARSTVIAGTYARTAAMFYFVASNRPDSMTAAFGPSPTRPFEEGRVASAVPFGGADGIGLAVLTNSGRAIGAMIAFSTGGAVRTATVDDARTQAFGRFTTYSSTVARRENVTLQRASDGTLMMAYRETRGARTELVLRSGRGSSASSFVELPAASRPAVGPRFGLLPVLFPSGEEMVVVYEALDATGQADIRLLRARDYGRAPGYAPLPLDPAQPWRLEDAGLIQRQGGTWIVILASKINGSSAELRYTEVPLSAFDLPPPMRGLHPGVVLDSAAVETRGRVGCKLKPLATCPMIWAGSSAPILFVRR